MTTSAAPRVKPVYGWRAAITDSDLAPSARLVLLCLSLYMNEKTTSCFPSYSTLAHDTGLDRRTVVRHIKEATLAGWITVERGAARRSNVYRAAIPTVLSTGNSVGAERHHLGAEDHSSRGTERSLVGAERHPNSPVNDPSNSDGAPPNDGVVYFAPGSGPLREHHAGDEHVVEVPDAWRDISDFDPAELACHE